MADGVFRQWLQTKRGQAEQGGTQFKFYTQKVTKSKLFKRQIVFCMLKLLQKGNRFVLCQNVHIAPKEISKLIGCIFRRCRIAAAQ